VCGGLFDKIIFLHILVCLSTILSAHFQSAGAPATPKKAAKSGGGNKKAGGKPQSGPGAKGPGATPPAPVQAVTQQQGSQPPSAVKDPALVEADVSGRGMGSS
jgi:hypothetical protein